MTTLYTIGPFNYFIDSKKSRRIFTTKKIKINQGELVLITGDSGAGKSTMLKMLKGLIPEHSINKIEGEFLFMGKPLDGESFKNNLKKILFLFQNPFSQIIHQNVPEEFYFSMENMMFTREEMLFKREELNQKFELSRIWNSRTRELSNGEAQKLVLASMLAVGPEVLLFDEPTAFLDPDSRREFYLWLQSIKGEKTIVIVDHHLDEVLEISDKVLKVKSSGELILVESKEEIRNSNINEENTEALKITKRATSKKIVLSNISFSYQGQALLFQNLNVSFKDNEVIVIKGQNGRGKSTLFKLISGLLKPISGSVELSIEDKKLSPKEVIKSVGFVFQNPEMHFFFDTVEDELKGLVKSPEHKELVASMLVGVDLKKSPFLLSEGEKRRLSILLLVLMNKSFYLYDEPTFGQDKNSIMKVRKIIKSLQQKNVLQLIISHDEEFIKSVATRVFELKNNSLVEV